ncbi:MAG: hypothetical protein KDA22_09785 [Phycisphaerales bacterium]|nr:hypothetical protein [Phycisphaerales bacterium]
MSRARLIQMLAVTTMIVGFVLGGSMLPSIVRQSEADGLRYTDVAVEGAPPIVQLGTAIGALRGIIVDYLWIKVNAMKQKGLFYEIMADSDLITKLQPRFAEVWGFNGHNMAYNVSVLTNNPEERWEWVKAGINLVRDKGLRYNPNDVSLNKELAFWFAHKIDGIADDAHFYYKREFAREWHLLLGTPPYLWEDRIDWIKRIADAPDTLDEAINGRPAIVVPTAVLEAAIESIQAVDEAQRKLGRRAGIDQAVDAVRGIVGKEPVSDFARKEIVRLVQTSDDPDSAIAALQRVVAADGELRPGFKGEPKVKELVERLKKDFSPFDARFRFALDGNFLRALGQWLAIQDSAYAKLLGLEQRFLANDPIFRVFEETGKDPEYADAWRVLVAHLRRRVLLDEYNMDPQLMYEFTRDLGPIDWRHPQAHALYWARRGQKFGERRYDNEDDVYKIVNNDRLQIQAMQALSRSGLMSVDPFSNDNPGRLNDPRWIRTVDRYFRVLYTKHYETRGAGGDTFTHFHENFMSSAVRELYRAGELEAAQEILNELDHLYGSGGLIPNAKYKAPLDVFVRDQTYGEYEMQPDVARSDVYSALQRGFREGLLNNRPEVLRDAIKFATDVTEYFQSSKYSDFVNKFGEARIGSLLGDLRSSVREVFTRLMLDGSLPLIDRLTIYNRSKEDLRQLVYDEVKPQLETELQNSPLAKTLEITQVLPEPPGMEAYRAKLAAERAREAEQGGGQSEFEAK